ncbi:hypothetical protein BRD14_07675 [Halobacteriales archaeon SW_5_68_122]|nr:MAG: hypothetical protein BRD14_07675 [Halobacteriales archaeon SW_5_68_122]
MLAAGLTADTAAGRGRRSQLHRRDRVLEIPQQFRQEGLEVVDDPALAGVQPLAVLVDLLADRDADVARLDGNLRNIEQRAGFQSWSACSARRPFSPRK